MIKTYFVSNLLLISNDHYRRPSTDRFSGALCDDQRLHLTLGLTHHRAAAYGSLRLIHHADRGCEVTLVVFVFVFLEKHTFLKRIIWLQYKPCIVC